MKSVELTVVGLQYRVTPATLRVMRQHLDGGPLRAKLEREPDNNHDENAIKVVITEAPYKGMHLGYLRREVAAAYAPGLDENTIQDPECWITDIDVDEGHALLLFKFNGRKGGKKTKGKQGKRGNREKT